MEVSFPREMPAHFSAAQMGSQEAGGSEADLGVQGVYQDPHL